MAKRSSSRSLAPIETSKVLGRDNSGYPILFIAISRQRIITSARQSAPHCMISEEIAELCPELIRIRTDIYATRFSDPNWNLRWHYALPRIAMLSLLEFDAGQRPAPFTFTLDTPIKVMPMHQRVEPVVDVTDDAKMDEERQRRARIAERNARRNAAEAAESNNPAPGQEDMGFPSDAAVLGDVPEPEFARRGPAYTRVFGAKQYKVGK